MAVTKLPLAPASDDGDVDDTPHQQQPQQPQQPAPGSGTGTASLHQHTLSNASTATVDIEAWTVSALESLNIAPITARGTGNTLSIPLDAEKTTTSRRVQPAPPPTDEQIEFARLKLRNAVVFNDKDGIDYGGVNGIIPPRRPPSRRDSMKKRDELQKGKEGSRQRRRWENDHLLHVPNVQPPQPTDWQVLPTHTVHANVPYQLAQYWDKGLRERVEERKAAFAVHRKKIITTSSSSTSSHHHLYDETTTTSTVVSGSGLGSGNNTAAATTTTVSVAISSASAHTRADVGKVPKDLRATAKRTPAVKSWLRVLEEPVRAFMVETIGSTTTTSEAEKKQQEQLGGDGTSDEMDSEDEEIVFVGRNGRMRDGKKGWEQIRKEKAAAAAAAAESQKQKQKQAEAANKRTDMVLDSLGEDETGAFKRWLTHSISDYYGLDSRSMTVGNPARRVVYVGVKQVGNNSRHHHHHHAPAPVPVRLVLPPPLWEMF